MGGGKHSSVPLPIRLSFLNRPSPHHDRSQQPSMYSWQKNASCHLALLNFLFLSHPEGKQRDQDCLARAIEQGRCRARRSAGSSQQGIPSSCKCTGVSAGPFFLCFAQACLVAGNQMMPLLEFLISPSQPLLSLQRQRQHTKMPNSLKRLQWERMRLEGMLSSTGKHGFNK